VPADEAKRYRFIPAGAGNTAGPGTVESAPSVHPRGRGEHFGRGVSAASWAGSSPRARGTQHPPTYTQHPDRFIPAGAGNTLTSRP